MTRKKLFCLLWASVFLTRLRFEGIGNPFVTFFGSASEGFSLAGWMLVAALRHVAPSAVAAHATAIAVIGALAFWLFPVARVCRWFGTHDPFAEGKRLPSPWRGAAAVLDTLHRLKLGKGKSGGWGMISALATHWEPGNLFVGRWSLGGHIGTLRPSSIPADGLGITVGRQGSGKSTAVAIPNMALHRGPLICFDAKGELAWACAARRGAGGQGIVGLNQACHIFDPLGISGLPGCRYNPLYEIAQEACTDDALRLMMKMAEGLLKTPDGGGGENSWVTSGGRQVAYGLGAYLLAAYPAERHNLVELRRLLQEGEIALAAAMAAGEKGKRPPTAWDALLVSMKTNVEGRFAHVSKAEAANLEKMGDRQLGSIFGALVEGDGVARSPEISARRHRLRLPAARFHGRTGLRICLLTSQ